ncbi:MAG: mechanosensitive ion channel [Acidobacteriota bacterium]
MTPLVIAGVVFVGLLPGRPEAPAPADASIDARYARLGATVHETVRTAALAVATMLALTAIGRTIEAVGLPGPSLVRWSFLLFWARGGFLSWLGLSLWARLALLFGAPSSVPFLVTSLARIVLLVMGGLVVGRLRHEIVALFEVHQISDAGETQDGAIAVTYNRMVHALGSFVAIYALGIVAVYALGHVELAGTLLFASLETFAILVLGFGLERLLHLLFRSRFKELDRIEALTGQPHALAREVLRASYMLLTLGVILLTTTVVLLCWGIRPDAAWTATRDALRRELVTINGTPLTLGSLLTFAAIVGGAFVVSRALRRFLARQVFPRSKVDKGVQHALSTILNYVILLAAGFMGFQSLGFDLTTLKVIVGAVGLGIGFGLQNIAANFISGLIILLERPINIDDVVEVSGTLGRIETVSARATHVRTRDNITVIVPNTEFISSRVVNWSHRDPRMRIHVAVGVAYGTPAGKVRETLLGVARGDRRVLHKPEPEVRLTGFGESAMAFQLLAWISDPWESERILSDLNYAVDEAFQREGIRIPFPQREVHVVDGRLPAALHGPEGSDAEARKHGGV